MARSKKNKVATENVVELSESVEEVSAIEVDVSEVSVPDEMISEVSDSVCCCAPSTETDDILMEAPEVFLGESTVNIEVTNRNITNNNSIKAEVNAAANEKRGLSNIQVMRETAAKLRAKKSGRRSPVRRGHINARFSIH